MRDRGSLYASVSVAVCAMLLSFIIHSPWSVPSLYSDIASFWGRPWLQQAQLPYIQAFFEYPPISGFLIYLSRIVGGTVFPSQTYVGYYSTFSLMSIAAAAVLAWSCWRIARVLKSRLNPLYFLLPSMIVYGVYSFDLFHAMFIALSLQMFLEGRKSSSALMLSFAIATKLVSAVLIPVYILEIKSLRPALKYLAIMSIPLAIIAILLAIFNIGYFGQFYQYFKAWGLEDAWFVWIFQNPSSWNYAKLFGLGLMGLLLVGTYSVKIELAPRVFLALTSLLLGTYVYAPQFNLMLIPIIAVLAIENPSVYFWDIFNVLIILTWFSTPNPTSAGAIPQVMSLLRAVALGWMSISLLAKHGIKVTSVLRYFPRLNPTIQGAKIRRTLRERTPAAKMLDISGSD